MSEQDEYTPAVDEVRAHYVSGRLLIVPTTYPSVSAEFDRMIAQVRREAAAEQREKDAQIAYKIAGMQPIHSPGSHDWDVWRTGRKIGNTIREQGTEETSG